ncbi:Sec7-domain-containing protein [Fistulina hepatica ATCC 64428]|nr:Sec7-domain-containing protein [Fistulina hepatica ATCC 64428]
MSSPSRHEPVFHKHVVLSEILSVTSTMRKNSRWASSSSVVTARDSSVLSSNLGLRVSPLLGDIKTIPLPTLLAPFFAIIRSPLSTGLITSAALSALHNFFVCGVIFPKSPSVDAALIELSSTVSRCKFEPTDVSTDEVVLFKIMTVIRDCLGGSMGYVLGDVEVCEMLETVLTTSCQMRLSEILRRTAENTMHLLVRTVFSRLHVLDPQIEEARLAPQEDAQEEIRMTVSASAPQFSQQASENSTDAEPEDAVSKTKEIEQEMPEDKDASSSTAATTAASQVHGLPSIIELLRVLVNVLDPNDKQHTDSTRMIALGILNSSFEAAGPRLCEFPSLEAIVLDAGCKFLFQLARSENMSVLFLALRTITTVFYSMSKRLKLQQELFIAFTIDRLAPYVPTAITRQYSDNAGGRKGMLASPRPGTPMLDADRDVDSGTSTPPRILVAPARGQIRDLILETFGQIARHPSFMVDLYTNYDCDINCENLFERLIDFLTKAIFPPQLYVSLDIQQRNAQYISLDLLLAFVNDMAQRAEGVAEPWPERYPSPESLLLTKSKKQLVLTGASRFNAKPKTGIAFLEDHKLIYHDLSPEVTKECSLAIFLKGCNRLDKRLLGDYMSKPENIEILKAFMDLFDWKQKPIDEALREMLETFRLPGEAQQISRITEIFASRYFVSGQEEIKNEDAVFVLAFSVIMLNTDQHNPQVRKRMSFEDYQRNLKGTNGGSDFPVSYLNNIYESIRKREIVMPEEHTGLLGFEYAWKELLTRSRKAGEFMICNTSLFDKEMFKTVWKPAITAIAYAFTSFDDDYIIQRAVAGFRQCATLASCFDLPDVFDYVVVSLSQATSLLADSSPAIVPNYPVIDIEGQSITVSGLSVKFGTNFKGQLAAVVLFNIVNGNGDALREGWTQIFEMFQNLFLHSLLPIRMLQMEDFLGGISMIPLRGSKRPKPAVRNDGGLLSTLSSYLMTPYASSAEALVPDATDSDIENTLCTIDCIASCRLDELYSQIMQLNSEALTAVIRALEALAHEKTVAKLKQEDTRDYAMDEQEDSFYLPYDPATVFLLETMVSITSQVPQYIEYTWPIVFEHLSALLSTASQYSALLIERAVVGLLRLCLILANRPALRDQIYLSLDLLAGLSRSVATAVAEQVIAGVTLLVHEHREIIQSQTEWNLVFALIRSTIVHPEAARRSFELVTNLEIEGPKAVITSDNFSGLITVLDDFALLASVRAENQQGQGNRRQAASTASAPVLERGKAAVEKIFDLKKIITPMAEESHLDAEQVWRHLCFPILASLSRQSSNASREIRHIAISALQRMLLGLLVDVESGQIEEVFNRVLFPLLDDLLKPETMGRDPRGMAETRLRASVLLCKAFMHFEVHDSRAGPDFRIVWIQVLDILARMMTVDRGDQMTETVPESLKNVLLVMNASGLLMPPSTPDERSDQQKTLWNSTHERMERFLPGFLAQTVVMVLPDVESKAD